MRDMVKRKAYMKKYREENKEQKARHDKKYREANKEKVAAIKKAHYKANKEAVDKKAKAYREANKELIKEQRKAYALKGKDVIAAYREANKEAISAQRKVYAKENKVKILISNAKYRLLKVNAEAEMSDAEKENYANLVAIRDEATALFGYAWHIDHTIPLSKGGTNAIDNLEVVPALWNEAKNNRNSDSFWG